MRKIPNKIRKKALELWLKGHNYRQIRGKLGISLGAISKTIDEVRHKAPNLDELRRLNLNLRKHNSNVHDAVRGSRLLEKVNQLGISFERAR